MKLLALFYLVLISSCSKESKDVKLNNDIDNLKDEVVFEALSVRTSLVGGENTIPVATLDFATLQPKQSGVQDLIITNGLSTDLVFGASDIDSSNISPFVLTESCSNKTIGRNRSCKLSFSVLNTPNPIETVLTKSLTIKGSVIQLTATLAADTTLVNAPISGISVSPSLLDFGAMKAGESKELSIVVSNRGTSTQSIAAPVISNPKISITSNTCSSLARNRSCSIKVRYSASNDESVSNQSFSSIANNDIKYSVLVQSPTVNEPQVLTINPSSASSNVSLTEPQIQSVTISFINSGTVELPSPVQAIAQPSTGVVINSVSCSGGLSRGRNCSVSYSLNSALIAGGISSIQLKLQSGTRASNIHTVNLNVNKLSAPCTLEDVQANGWNIANQLTISGMKSGSDVSQCGIESCNQYFSVNNSSKSCDADICTTENAPVFGVNLSNALTILGNAPNCIIESCSSNYKIAGDAKSCLEKLCTELSAGEISSLGFNTTNATISGTYPSCSLSCNSSFQQLSSDNKSCVDKTPTGSISFANSSTNSLTGNILNITESNAQQIQFYSDNICSSTIGVLHSLPMSSIEITLSGSLGTKNIYAKLINGLAVSSCLSASIVYEAIYKEISILNSTIPANASTTVGTHTFAPQATIYLTTQQSYSAPNHGTLTASSSVISSQSQEPSIPLAMQSIMPDNGFYIFTLNNNVEEQYDLMTILNNTISGLFTSPSNSFIANVKKYTISQVSNLTILGMFEYNNQLYFNSSNQKLFKTNSLGQVSQVSNTNTSGSDSPFPFIVFNNELYFRSTLSGVNQKLFKVNTSGQVSQVSNTRTLGDNLRAQGAILNNELYFPAQNNSGHLKLFKVNTSGQVSQVSNTRNGASDQIGFDAPIVYNNEIYFGAYNTAGTDKLFKVNTSGQVSQVSNTCGSNSCFDSPSSFFIFNNELYFNARKSDNTQKLFKVNSEGQVYQVSNIVDGDWDSANNFTVYNNELYFTNPHAGNISKLYKINTQGQIVNVINTANSRPSIVSGLTVYNNELYFVGEIFYEMNEETWEEISIKYLYKINAQGQIKQVSDTNGDENKGDSPQILKTCHDDLYFVAKNNSDEDKLFKVNLLGQVSQVSSINADAYVSSCYGNELYFRGPNGLYKVKKE